MGFQARGSGNASRGPVTGWVRDAPVMETCGACATRAVDMLPSSSTNYLELNVDCETLDGMEYKYIGLLL